MPGAKQSQSERNCASCLGRRADGNKLVKSTGAAIKLSMAPSTDLPSNTPSLTASDLLSSAPSSSSPPATKTRRLSLSSLCNPSPAPSTINMLSPAEAGPSSPRSPPRSAQQRSLMLSPDDESVMIAVSALDDMRSGSRPSASSSRSVGRLSSPGSLSFLLACKTLYSRVNSFSDSTPALTATSTSSTPSNAPKSPPMTSDEAAASVDFVSRVSGLPIVNTALRAYEQSKASSRVVKVCCSINLLDDLLLSVRQYGAEMMESSMKSISRPVIDRLPVNQLDEFACRQLDRVWSSSTFYLFSC